MTHIQLRNFIVEMHQMGATDIVVGDVRVKFPAPQTVQALDATEALDARVQQAIDDIHEEKMDADEVEDARNAKRAAEANKELFYVHGG